MDRRRSRARIAEPIVLSAYSQRLRSARRHRVRRTWSAHANIICGYGTDVKPTPGNLGHYHNDFAEMWVIMRGQQRFTIEGLQPMVASEGDVLYAPAKRWHLPEPYGDQFSCRLAMTPYPAGNHLYQPRS